MQIRGRALLSEGHNTEASTLAVPEPGRTCTHTGGWLPLLAAVQAQRTKATVPLLKSAKRVILLTGTPALNKPKVKQWRRCEEACTLENSLQLPV